MAFGTKWETWVKLGSWEQHCAKVTSGHNAKLMEELPSCSLKKAPDEVWCHQEAYSCNEDNVLSLLDQGVSGEISKSMWECRAIQTIAVHCWLYTSHYLTVVHMLNLSDSLSPSKVLVFHYSELDLFTEFQNTCLFMFSLNFRLFFPAKTIFCRCSYIYWRPNWFATPCQTSVPLRDVCVLCFTNNTSRE